jgi:hypothetical protein
MKRLHGVYRLMMKLMEKTVGKKLREKTDRTAEETEMLSLLQNGADRVSLENLSGVLSWYRGQS